jgi:putative oxidoreductase
MTLAWALLVIRVVAGLTLAAHGAQKLLGWFGGPGYTTLTRGFTARGYKPAWLWAALVVLGELGGGLSLALGMLTPLGAAGGVGAMAMAAKTHWPQGYFNAKGGFEYPVVLLAMCVGIGLAGPGAYAVDALLVPGLPQALVFGVLSAAAVAVDVVGSLLMRVPSAAA